MNAQLAQRLKACQKKLDAVRTQIEWVSRDVSGIKTAEQEAGNTAPINALSEAAQALDSITAGLGNANTSIQAAIDS